MANPFLRRYLEGSLLVKTNAGNLFWILILMLGAGLAVLGLTLWAPGIGGEMVVPALAIFLTATFTSGALLGTGHLKAASRVAFGALFTLMAAVALFSRSGLSEMDAFQTAVIFFLGLLVLQGVGVGGLLTGVWVAGGAGVLVWIFLVPYTDYRTDLTIAQWNLEFNPFIIAVLYLVGSLGGTLLLIQSRRNLQLMQFDQDVIQASNEMLEATVEERTQALRTILDSSGQGLFTFGPRLEVEPEYSAGCRTIFGQDIAGADAARLLFPQAPDLAEEFRQGLSLFFAGKTKASVIFDLLEKEAFVRGRALNLEYREVGPQRLLCVVTDVTLDRQLAERNRADEARRTLVLRAVGHKRFFAGLLAEAEALFSALRVYEEQSPGEAEARALLAQIHTFKGNCGFFGFSSTGEVAHDFEHAIGDSLILGEELDYRDLALDLKRSYYQELNVILEALGRGWVDEAGGIVIPRQVFEQVSKYIAGKYPGETKLNDVLEHFRKMSLKELFSRFAFVAEATAEKLGKKIRPLEITGGDLRVVPDRLDGLVGACVHIINNMVDHGIEPPYVRESQGKAPEGQLKIDIRREESSVILEFSDDGQGIALPEIEARARKRGLLGPDDHPGPRDLLQLIFAPGFSTRDEATEVSGRGIGLAAVKAEAERLGGRIEVQTKIHQGTTFEIILPPSVFARRRQGRTDSGAQRRPT